MAMPANTKNFDALTGAVSTVAPINLALSQISYGITQLQTVGLSFGLVTIPITAGESLTERDVAYLNPSDNKMYAIDANAAPALAGTVRGFVEETVSGAALGSLVIGGILGGFSGLTAWLPVYADSTGAGTVTQTRPYPLLDSGQMAIVPLGMAISTTQVAVMPAFMDKRIRYQARYSPALDETITLQHGLNRLGLSRKVAAYVSQGNVLAEYASSNQDANSMLQGIVAPGGSIDTNGTGSTAPLGDSGGTETWQAQSFIPTEGLLGLITIAFGANTGSPSGDMTWKIVNDNAGQPTGTVLSTGTHTITPSADNNISVPSSNDGIYVNGSSTYWLRLEVPAQATNARWNVVCSTSSAYANGQRSSSTNGGSSWSGVSTSDMDVTITNSAISSNDKLAQGFQISSANTVEKVRLWLKKVGSPSGNLTVKIQTNNAGNPSGTTVTNGTSATVAASSLSTSLGWIEFTFSTPPSLSASTQYHIVLETSDSQSDVNHVVWGSDYTSPGYASGVMKRERSAVWSNEGKVGGADAVFRVLAANVQYVNQVKVDWWTSTQADMVNQFGDSSSADIDTKTTFKCKAASGFEDVTVEVVV